jgi:hypothetical protein
VTVSATAIGTTGQAAPQGEASQEQGYADDQLRAMLPKGTLDNAVRMADTMEGNEPADHWDRIMWRMGQAERAKRQQDSGVAGRVTDPDIDPVDLVAGWGLPALGRQYLTRSALPGSYKAAYAAEVPQFRAWLQEAGNPLSNSLKAIVESARSALPETMGDMAPAMASAGPDTVAKSLFEEIIPRGIAGHWNVRVPYYASRSQYPIPLQGSSEGINQAFQALSPGSAPMDSDILGWFASLGEASLPRKWMADAVGIADRPGRYITIKHELGHMANSRLQGQPGFTTGSKKALDDILQDQSIIGDAIPNTKGNVPDFMKSLLESLPDQYPVERDALKTVPAYDRLSPRLLGDELLSRAVSHDVHGPPIDYDLLSPLAEVVQRHYHPAWESSGATGLWPTQTVDLIAKYLQKRPEALSKYEEFSTTPTVGNLSGVSGPSPSHSIDIKKGQGGRNLIESFDDTTGAKRGALGYVDNEPQVGFTNIHSSDPRGTIEMVNALQRELGPRMNDMRIRTEIMPQSAELFGRMADRWKTKYPDLSDRIRRAVEMSQGHME